MPNSEPLYQYENKTILKLFEYQIVDIVTHLIK